MSKATIVVDEEDIPYFKKTILGYEYSFTLRSIPEDKREWLVMVLDRMFDDIHKRACRRVVVKVKERFDNLFCFSDDELFNR